MNPWHERKFLPLFHSLSTFNNICIIFYWNIIDIIEILNKYFSISFKWEQILLWLENYVKFKDSLVLMIPYYRVNIAKLHLRVKVVKICKKLIYHSNDECMLLGFTSNFNSTE